MNRLLGRSNRGTNRHTIERAVAVTLMGIGCSADLPLCCLIYGFIDSSLLCGPGSAVGLPCVCVCVCVRCSHDNRQK